MTPSWCPIHSGIVDSSIWEEDPLVLKVFIGMLSIKDSAQMVWMDSYKLARRIHMEHEVVLRALSVLTAPDKRRADQEHEGRRLEAREDGWWVINGEKYYDQMRIDQKRARDRRSQANRRARLAGKPEPFPKARKPEKHLPPAQPPVPAESASVENNGANHD